MNRIEYEDRAKVYQKAIELYGAEAQIHMVIEEMSEPTKELGELRRGIAHELDRIESKADMLAGELGVELKNDPPKGPSCSPF